MPGLYGAIHPRRLDILSLIPSFIGLRIIMASAPMLNLWPSSFLSRRALVAAAVVVHLGCGSSPSAPTPPGLKVTSISPSSGSTTGGTLVTLSGAEFAGDAVVTIGGVPASDLTLLGPTSLTAVVGARPTPGPADVTVSSGGKTATLPGGFTFVSPGGGNAAPVVTAITGTGSRQNQPANFGDVGEAIKLTATVTDAETPASQLTYQWSGPGTFSQQSATTIWTVPTDQTTPGQITVTLKVSETYSEGGVGHTNVSAPATYVLNVHDSQKEILAIGEDFLRLFSQSDIPAGQVLHNFSATCDNGNGRAGEQADVENNREDFIENYSAFRIQARGPVTFNFGGTCFPGTKPPQPHVDACASYAVHWDFIEKSNGKHGTEEGIDYVSAVLESNQWRLCHSSYVGTGKYPSFNR
jgi:hypothetical protein